MTIPRGRTARIPAVLLPAVALAALAVPASARSVSSAVRLYNYQSECIKSNGAGNQATIDSDCAAWIVVHSRTGGDGLQWQVENAAGHCLRAHSDKGIYYQSTGCDTSDQSEWIHPANQGPANEFNYYDEGQGGWILTVNHTDGSRVFAGARVGGTFYNWTSPGG